MGDMLLGVANSSYVTLNVGATYGYTFTNNIDKHDIRTKGGDLYTYITAGGNFRRFRVPMTYVLSADRAQVNSWFETGTDLRFIEDDSFANSYYTVRITGKTDPFTKFTKPYFRQRYEGEIIIETT